MNDGHGRPAALLTGAAAALLVVLPGWRPFELPVAYAAVAAVLLQRLFAAPPERGFPVWRPLLAWALLAALGSLWILAGDSRNGIAYAGRSLVSLAAAALLAQRTAGGRHATAALWGAAPLLAADALVGILQYEGFGLGAEAAAWFGQLAETSEVDVDDFARVRGMQSAAHMFAASQGAWAMLLLWVSGSGLLRSRRARAGTLLLLAVSATAAVVSGQRSVVWSLAVLMPLAAGLLGGTRSLLLWSALCGTALLGIRSLLLDGTLSIGALERLAEIGHGNADVLRLASMRAGWDAIQSDPFFGTARADGPVGIHNGYLSGWARIGIAYPVLLGWALWRTWLSLRLCQLPPRQRRALCLVPALPLLNAMAHTNMLGVTDMTWTVLLGYVGMVAAHARGTVPGPAPAPIPLVPGVRHALCIEAD